tara:strand:+ start:217 stop:438 length:222 start_codon:yes stop_codon:yes gene_type:complete
MEKPGSESLQSKCKKRLEALMPDSVFRVSNNALLTNVSEVTREHLEYLSIVDGMYSDINIKRSGKGVVILLIF